MYIIKSMMITYLVRPGPNNLFSQFCPAQSFRLIQEAQIQPADVILLLNVLVEYCEQKLCKAPGSLI